MKNSVTGPCGFVMLVALSVGLVGCGGDAAPSPAAPTAAAIASAAAVSESGHGGGSNSSEPNKEVELTGTTQAMSGRCFTLQLTVAGRSVVTTAATEFKGVACAGLAVGQTVEVKGTMQADGSVAAARIQVEVKDNDEKNEGEASGAITASTGVCPMLTFTVGTTTVRTTEATVFHDAACGALPLGTVIEAKGTKQSDGSLLATRIERPGVE